MRTKRQCASDAEKIAVDITKIFCANTLPTRFTLDSENRITFLPSSGVETAERCTWREKGLYPRYCKCACLRFETCMPDRSFLARYSVKCARCDGQSESVRHLFCSFCNEILTGHIAGPGGKISDHLVTIRHLFHEAMAMSSYVRVNSSCEPADRDARLNVQQIADYISNLDEWAKTIRFPSKSSAKRQDFELIVRQMTGDLSRLCAKVQEVEHQQSQQPSMNCMSQCTDEPANRGEALFDESCESHVDRLMSKARIVALPESLHVPAHQDAADQEAPSPHCHASRRRRSSSHRPPPISVSVVGRPTAPRFAGLPFLSRRLLK
mmetsp:Transcript_993/g.2509  ORF Transcript_993/g.2509 Transcript_993/m.2509 type:complete len:323 (-) Transcript_993:379-1347(-)